MRGLRCAPGEAERSDPINERDAATAVGPGTNDIGGGMACRRHEGEGCAAETERRSDYATDDAFHG